MDTPGFLRHVLPSSGMYCAFTLVGEYPRQKFFDDIDKLVSHLQQMSDKGYNTYYAVSSFTKEHRKQEHTAFTKALYLDVDCGEDKP